MNTTQLVLFSHQNQDRILRKDEAMALSGLSRTTLWRLERDGNFPARRQLSVGAVGWLKSEIDAWIEARQAITSGNCRQVAVSSRRGRKPKMKNSLDHHIVKLTLEI